MRKISRMGQIFIILLIHILYHVLFYSFGVKRPFPSFYEMLVLIMLIFSVCNFKTDNTWKIKIVIHKYIVYMLLLLLSRFSRVQLCATP